MSCLCPLYSIFEMLCSPTAGLPSYAFLIKAIHTKQSNINVQFKKKKVRCRKGEIFTNGVAKQ